MTRKSTERLGGLEAIARGNPSVDLELLREVDAMIAKTAPESRSEARLIRPFVRRQRESNSDSKNVPQTIAARR